MNKQIRKEIRSTNIKKKKKKGSGKELRGKTDLFNLLKVL